MKEKKKQTRLGKRRRRRKRIRRIIMLLLLLAVGLAACYLVRGGRIRKIVIEGNVTYTTGEIEERIRQEEYEPNSFVMTLHNHFFHPTYFPFIEEARMSVKADKPGVLHVKVKEKGRAGVFEYMNRFFYFNEDGYTMESRNSLFEEVPLVTGVQFKEVKPGEKIKARGDYTSSVIAIVRGIRNYEIQVYEIHFDSEDEITLDCGSFKIYLGSVSSLDGKMSRIPAILEAVSKEHKGGTIDLHLFEEDKEYITFKE